MSRPVLILLLLAWLLQSCATRSGQDSYITSFYNKELDETTLVVPPYGRIAFPGEWHLTSFNEASHQHIFKNERDETLAIAKGTKSNYSFYQLGQSDLDFVRAFYQWDHDFLVQKGFRPKLLKENPEQQYLVWQVQGKEMGNIFLYGVKGGQVYNLLISSEARTEAVQVQLLEQIFRSN